MIELKFNFNTPGANTNLKFYQKKKIKDRVRAAVYDALWELGLPSFTEYVQVEFTRYSVQPMDEDNVAASAKVWIDRLVEYGVIKDDRPVARGGHVHLTFVSAKGRPSVTIRIESCES